MDKKVPKSRKYEGVGKKVDSGRTIGTVETICRK
jgi:hypothetical protein